LAVDHSIATAHIMQNKLNGYFKGITAEELKADIDSGMEQIILDVRNPDEYEQMRLGINETLIPLGQLRSRLRELPDNRNTPIVVYCKISLRGYEAALILQANGYTDVSVLEGGIMAWPFGREK